MPFGKNSSIQTTLTSNSSNLEEQTIDQALNLSEQMVGKTSMFYAECIFKTRWQNQNSKYNSPTLPPLSHWASANSIRAPWLIYSIFIRQKSVNLRVTLGGKESS